MDRGAWWATIHRFAKSWTRLKPILHTHTHTHKEYYSTIQRNKVMILATVYMTLENIISEKRQTQMIMSYMTHVEETNP